VPIPRKTDAITPSVTHSPIAERESCQAGSRTGDGAVVIPLILAVTGRSAARATMECVMPQQVPTVSVAELPEDAVVLDVREDDEWVHGHIEGATHIPMGDVPVRLDEVPEADVLYVTCRGGGRSARVAAWLNLNGFDAVNVAGGMGEWEAAGRPMVSETGEPPFVR
jgi:rhodanese-related sulfurtransferase